MMNLQSIKTTTFVHCNVRSSLLLCLSVNKSYHHQLQPFTLRRRYCRHNNNHHHNHLNNHHESTGSTESTTTTSATSGSGMISSFIRWYSLRLETHPYIIKGMTSGFIAATGDLTCQYLMSSSSTTSHNNLVQNYSVDTNDTGNHDCDVDSADTDSNYNDNRSPSESSISKSSSNSNFDDDDDDATVLLVQRSFLQLPGWWWDTFRTVRFGILGAFYVAPGCHLWYHQLSIWFPIVHSMQQQPHPLTLSVRVIIPVLQRVIMDQFLFTPIFLIGWLLSLSKLESVMSNNTTKTKNQSIHEQNDLSFTSTNNNATFNTTFQNMYHTIIVENQLVQLLYSNWILWIPVQLCNFYYIPTKYQVLTSNCVAFVWNMCLSYMTSSSSSSLSSSVSNKSR
jgi:hypothetical protein